MKILKGIASTILTLIVIPVLMVFIVYLSANSIVSKKNVEKIVKEINISNFLVDEEGNYNELGKDIKEELVKNGLPGELVDDFVDSEAITDFFAEYAGKITDYIINDKEIEQVTADDIERLINDNVDSIVDELRKKKVEGYEELTDDNVAEFKSKVGEISKEIEKNLPDLEEAIDDTDAKETFDILRFVFGPIVYTLLICIIVVLLVFILLLNIKRYSFLIWFGVIFIISSVPFVAISRIVPALITESESRGLIDITKYVFDKLNTYSFGFLITGIILIVLACILKASDSTNNQEQTGI